MSRHTMVSSRISLDRNRSTKAFRNEPGKAEHLSYGRISGGQRKMKKLWVSISLQVSVWREGKKFLQELLCQGRCIFARLSFRS